MSHEIRTPMNGVIGMIELLLETEMTPEQRKYAETVQASGEALLKLINDILDFSKIEAGKLDIEKIDFDIHDLLDDIIKLMAGQIDEKGLEFTCTAAPDVPTNLQGDPGRLRQVLTNLIGNAVKFTSEGEIAVRVDLEEETDEKVTLRFSVRDTGIGISKEKQDLLFESFQQLDSSTTRNYGGTGLGLTISKCLVEMMGGEIGVESEEGKGAVFWFTVQLGRHPESGRVEARVLSSVGGVRMLVVDDGVTNRDNLVAQLDAWGARATAADCCETAMKLLIDARKENDPFNVVILDARMTGLGGETLGHIIRADQRLIDTRIIMMSKLGRPGYAQLLEEIGPAFHLTKPTRYSDLRDCLIITLTDGADATTAQSNAADHPAKDTHRSDTRILLTEDNITNQIVAVGMLNKLGLSVDVAANGKEAIAALKDRPYDLVLMDCQMPEMDGFETTRAIRSGAAGARNSQVPIIAITAHALKGYRERCLTAGMNDYITKPIKSRDLARIVEKWLTRPEDHRPAVETFLRTEATDTK